MADLPPPPSASPPATFTVDIQRGHRALAESVGADSQPPPRRPTRKVGQRASRLRLAGKLLGLAIFTLAGFVWLGSRPPPGALARVNEVYITTAQLDREVLIRRVFSELSAGSGGAETRTAMLERLINQQREAQAVTRTGMVITAADLDSEIDRVRIRQGWTAAQLAAALTRQGLSRSDLRASLQDVTLVTRYAEQVLAAPSRDSAMTFDRQSAWAGAVARSSQVIRYGSPEMAGARIGAPAPDFTLLDLTGQPTALAAFRGRPVLVNFWATWCQPCRVEMPVLMKAYRQVQAARPDALVVLAVAYKSAPSTVSAFRREFDLPFPVLPDTQGEVLNRYGVGPIPTSFLIDRQGIIRWMRVGTWDDALLADKLQLVP